MTNYFELIDDYIEDKLSPEDKHRFEQAMAIDEKLAHAVENYPLLKKLSASLIEDEVRQQLKSFENKPNQATELKKIIPMWKWMAAAASVAVVIVSAYFINKDFGKISNDLIIENLYQRPASQGTRGEEEDMNRIDSAIYKFDTRHFDEAKALFMPRPQNDSLAKVTDYYLAHIALIKTDYNTSERLFASLSTDKKYGQLAQYNLMIIYLLTKQKGKAKESFLALKKQDLLSESQADFIEKLLR